MNFSNKCLFVAHKVATFQLNKHKVASVNSIRGIKPILISINRILYVVNFRNFRKDDFIEKKIDLLNFRKHYLK